jgi:hypothetical protein
MASEDLFWEYSSFDSMATRKILLTPAIDLLEIALMTYSAVNPTLNIRTVTLF